MEPFLFPSSLGNTTQMSGRDKILKVFFFPCHPQEPSGFTEALIISLSQIYSPLPAATEATMKRPCFFQFLKLWTAWTVLLKYKLI